MRNLVDKVKGIIIALFILCCLVEATQAAKPVNVNQEHLFHKESGLVSLHFRNAPVSDIIQLLAKRSKKNMVLSRAVNKTMKYQ